MKPRRLIITKIEPIGDMEVTYPTRDTKGRVVIRWEVETLGAGDMSEFINAMGELDVTLIQGAIAEGRLSLTTS